MFLSASGKSGKFDYGTENKVNETLNESTESQSFYMHARGMFQFLYSDDPASHLDVDLICSSKVPFLWELKGQC